MRGSGEKPVAAILGTGSDFWLGRAHCEDVFEISRACQRQPPAGLPPRLRALPCAPLLCKGWGRLLRGASGAQCARDSDPASHLDAGQFEGLREKRCSGGAIRCMYTMPARLMMKWMYVPTRRPLPGAVPRSARWAGTVCPCGPGPNRSADP
jgi:hypothetical protein